LAAGLAAAFDLPLLDKDDILEALFDAPELGNRLGRQELSRASDIVLMRLASRSNGAVLASHWRHPAETGESGTPIAGIAALSRAVVEVHCTCPPALALERFAARARHSRHQDGERDIDALTAQFERLAARGPLGLGALVEVDTSREYDLDAVIALTEAAFDNLDRSA
jgi:glucokinase